MSIPQLTLDDRTYADLLDEARALIPSLAPQWTNHNPSDPGITLIELFAWLTEMLIYRVNRLPEASTLAFLRLLNGRQWNPGPDLDEDIRATVLTLRQRYRAVTAEDYEALARESSPGVGRVSCVPRCNLAEETEADRSITRAGYVSVVVLPDPSQADAVDPDSKLGAPLPSSALLSAVRDYLQPRRLLTVRQIVAPPVYVPIQVELILATRPGASAVAPGLVVDTLSRFLGSSTGGPDGKGWPFGRDVYVSELYRLLEREIPGVDYVPDITLSSTCKVDASRCVAGTELWNDYGDQIGIELSPHHLPWPQIDLDRIVIGSVFLPVSVSIQATASDEKSNARQAVKTAIKRLFHPLHEGPRGGSSWEITERDIYDKVNDLPEIQAVGSVKLEGSAARPFRDGATTGLRFEAGEMADLTIQVTI